MQPCNEWWEEYIMYFATQGWLTLSMCNDVAFGCTTALGSASLAVADTSTNFEDLTCSHAMNGGKNKF